jgi:hypothetical protein
MQYGEAFTTLRGSVDLRNPASQSVWIEASPEQFAMPEIQINKSKKSSGKAIRKVSQPELHLRNEVRRLQAALVDKFRGNSRFVSGGGFKGSESSHARQCDECSRMQKAVRRIKLETKELRSAAEVMARNLAESELLRENLASQLLKQRKVAFETQGRSALGVDRVLQGRHRTLEQQKHVVELESTIQSLRDDLTRLQKDRRVEQMEIAEKRKLSDDSILALKRAQLKIAELTARAEHSDQALLDAARMKHRLEDSEFETKNTKRQLQEAEQGLLEAGILSDGLQQEVCNEKQRCEQAEKQVEVLSAEAARKLSVHGEQSAEHEARLAEKDEQIEQGSVLIRRLQQKLKLVEEEIDDRRRERREREEELREKDMRLATLEEAVDETRQRHSHTQSQADEELGLLRVQCAAQEEELRKLRAQAGAAQTASAAVADAALRERAKLQKEWDEKERAHAEREKAMEESVRLREQQLLQAQSKEQEDAAARTRHVKAELTDQLGTRDEQLRALRKQLQQMQQLQQEQQTAEQSEQSQMREELCTLEEIEADLRAQLAAHLQKLEKKELQSQQAVAEAAEREQRWERGREEERQDYEAQCAELAARLAQAEAEAMAQQQAQRLEESARQSSMASLREFAHMQADEAARAKEALIGMGERLREAQEQAAQAAQVAGRQARDAAGEYLSKNLVQMCVVAPMVTVNWGNKDQRFKTKMPSAQIRKTLEAGVLPRFVSLFLQEPEGKQPGVNIQATPFPGSPLGEGQTLHEWVAGQGAKMQCTLEEELRPVFEAAMPSPAPGAATSTSGSGPQRVGVPSSTDNTATRGRKMTRMQSPVLPMSPLVDRCDIFLTTWLLRSCSFSVVIAPEW